MNNMSNQRLVDPTHKMLYLLTGKNPSEVRRRDKSIKFPVKLMYVLQCRDYEEVIDWSHNGLLFVIKNTELFEERVLPELFKEAKFQSFDRKLTRWGFTKAKSNRTKKAKYYGHPLFRRGDFPRCMKIDTSGSDSCANADEFTTDKTVSVEDLALASILKEQEEEDTQADNTSTTKEAGEIMLALAAAGRSSTCDASSGSAASSNTTLPPLGGRIQNKKIIAESCNMSHLVTATAKSSLPFGIPPQRMPAEMSLGTAASTNNRFVQHHGKDDKLFERGMRENYPYFATPTFYSSCPPQSDNKSFGLVQNTFPSPGHDLTHYPEGFPASYGGSSGITPYYHPRQLPNQGHISYYANGTRSTTISNVPPSNGGIVLGSRRGVDSSQGVISREFIPDGDSNSSFMRTSYASPPLLGGGSRMQHSFHSAARPNNVEGYRGTIEGNPSFFFKNSISE